jgi:hypothetical protein
MRDDRSAVRGDGEPTAIEKEPRRRGNVDCSCAVAVFCFLWKRIIEEREADTKKESACIPAILTMYAIINDNPSRGGPI